MEIYLFREKSGSVEIAIRLIKRLLPKKTDFATITREQFKHIEDLINDKFRKILNYKTPQAVFDVRVGRTPRMQRSLFKGGNR